MSTEQTTYRVVFWGEVILGHSRSDVAKRFAKWFRVQNQKTLKKLFAGPMLTLKKGLDYEQAQLYSDVIRGLGGVCRVEPEQRPLAGCYPEQRRHSEQQHQASARISEAMELKLLEKGESIAEPSDNPFAARDLSRPQHPPCKYYDPRAANSVLSRKVSVV